MRRGAPELTRTLVRLALPVAAVQVGMMLMGVVDTIMVGHVSPQDLAGVALGNIYFFACAVFGMGLLFSLDPVVSQAVGAGDAEGMARGVQRAILLAVRWLSNSPIHGRFAAVNRSVVDGLHIPEFGLRDS